jgi:hypothetical protein
VLLQKIDGHNQQYGKYHSEHIKIAIYPVFNAWAKAINKPGKNKKA